MAFYRLEKLINLYDGYRQVFRVNGMPLLLMQEEGRLYLIRNECPHKAFPLHTGTVNRGILRCAYHAMEFDLARGGRCVQHPQSAPLQFYTLHYEGNEVGVVLG